MNVNWEDAEAEVDVQSIAMHSKISTVKKRFFYFISKMVIGKTYLFLRLYAYVNYNIYLSVKKFCRGIARSYEADRNHPRNVAIAQFRCYFRKTADEVFKGTLAGRIYLYIVKAVKNVIFRSEVGGRESEVGAILFILY